LNVQFSFRGYGARDAIPPRSSNRKSRRFDDYNFTDITTRQIKSQPSEVTLNNGVDWIATFDGDFDRIKGVRRIKLP
jgi:hypothetical protein